MKKLLKNKKFLILSLGAAVLGASVVAVAAACTKESVGVAKVSVASNTVVLDLSAELNENALKDAPNQVVTVSVIDVAGKSTIVAQAKPSTAEKKKLVLPALNALAAKKGYRVLVNSKYATGTFLLSEDVSFPAKATTPTTPTTPVEPSKPVEPSTPVAEAYTVSTVAFENTAETSVSVKVTFSAALSAKNVSVKLVKVNGDTVSTEDSDAKVVTVENQSAAEVTAAFSGLTASTKYRVTEVKVGNVVATLPTSASEVTTSAAASTPTPADPGTSAGGGETSQPSTQPSTSENSDTGSGSSSGNASGSTSDSSSSSTGTSTSTPAASGSESSASSSTTAPSTTPSA